LLEGGYGKIAGRMKDMIIRTGDKIFPTEIEDFFMEHPDILEAQVKFSVLMSAHRHKRLPKSLLNVITITSVFTE
jgi:phenylacetate-coenzyme A ligase PaaK-like adenylate-forming protein